MHLKPHKSLSKALENDFWNINLQALDELLVNCANADLLVLHAVDDRGVIN
jgi:hypothetical protein